MNKLLLTLLIVGCLTCAMIPEAEAQGGYWGGGSGSCQCRYRCYHGERWSGRCGYRRVRCCRRWYGGY